MNSIVSPSQISIRCLRFVPTPLRYAGGFAGADATLRPSARSIGELGRVRLAAGQGCAPAEALPLYVRHRVALTIDERAAGARL